MRRYSLPLSMILLCSGAIGVAQQPPSGATPRQLPAVEFRTETNFVEINAVVTDKAGNFVRDLTKDDFQIYEDGKPQTPSIFALVDLPIALPATALTPELTAQPIESDVRSTKRDFDGRLYVLLLDDLQTTLQRSEAVRDAAKRFIQQYLGENDLAAVVCTSGRDEAEQELTGSRRALLAAIDKFYGRKLPSAGAEKLAMHLSQGIGTPAENDDGTTPIRSPEGLDAARQVRDPLDAERGDSARRTLGSLGDAARWMADIHGRRKALVWFSEGIDYDIYEPFNRGAASAVVQQTRDAVGMAQRANVTVYAVDPRGLNQVGDAVATAGKSDYPQLEFGTFRGVEHELLLAQESLISLAQETGGLAVVNTNDVAGGLATIARDNSRYYLLGYFGNPAGSPGKFRKIDVKVNRPGLRVRARKGYVSADPEAIAKAREIEAKAGTSPALKAALTNPLSVSSLPFRVFAAPFKGPGKNASVLIAVEIDGSGLKFNERDGRFNESIELSIVAVDQSAKVQGEDRQTFDLKLLPETHEQIRRTGVRLLSRLNVPPSRYQIRVGVHESAGAAVGAVPYDLDVPDYSKSAFILSGVVVTSSRAGELVTTAQDPQLKDTLPAAPIATRAFDRQSLLTAFAELYVTPGPVASQVEFVATVRSAADGRGVFSTRDTRTLGTSTKSLTHGFKTEVPLGGFSPGLYVLRIEVRSTAKGQSTYREVPFDVN